MIGSELVDGFLYGRVDFETLSIRMTHIRMRKSLKFYSDSIRVFTCSKEMKKSLKTRIFSGSLAIQSTSDVDV